MAKHKSYEELKIVYRTFIELVHLIADVEQLTEERDYYKRLVETERSCAKRWYELARLQASLLHAEGTEKRATGGYCEEEK